MNDNDQFVEWYTLFFEEFFKMYPTAGTYSGRHEYDHLIGDISKSTYLKRQETFMAYWKEMMEKFNRECLSFKNQLDFDLLNFNFNFMRFQFGELESWKTGFMQSGPV
ncbi:MAG: hypothetical protein ACXAC7_18135, partial [Candidatus Hodarchaeales archaeon]